MPSQAPTTNPSVNIVRAGPGGGTPVILLHAVSLDLTYWDAQFARLSANRDVVAFDWPGHGRSSPLAWETSFDRMAEAVDLVVREVGGGPAHIVGLSMGSMVAQIFALNHPAAVRSLCLIGSACTFPEPVRAGMRKRATTIRAGGMPAVVAETLARWYTPGFRQRRPDVIDRATKTILGADPGVQATMWEMIAELDTRERLASLACPTLVLVGAEDPSTPPDAARVIAGQIPGARVAVVDGASHMTPTEAPDAVSDLLETFLEEC